MLLLERASRWLLLRGCKGSSNLRQRQGLQSCRHGCCKLPETPAGGGRPCRAQARQRVSKGHTARQGCLADPEILQSTVGNLLTQTP